MLKTSRIFLALSIATIVWAVLFGINTEEYTAYVEHTGHFPSYPSYVGLFLFVGFVLFPIWVIAGVVKRNIKVIVALIGIVVASFFFIAATTENIGYSLEDVIFQINGPGYSIYGLNPFLHLGGGRIIDGNDLTFKVAVSSFSMKNLILYTVYGESISFSIMGIYIITKKQYFKAHSIELLTILIGATIAIITLYCDFISLYGEPPLVVKRILTQWQKPGGMSIFPPACYYFNPPGGYLVPLSLADLFSLYFPIAFFGFIIIEVFRYYRWRKKTVQNAIF